MGDPVPGGGATRFTVSLHPSPSLSNHLSFAVLQYIGYLIGRLENKADEQPQAAAAEPKPANTQTPRGTTPHAWRLHWPTATHHTIMEFVEYIYIVTWPFDTNKIGSSGHRRTFVRRRRRRQPNQHRRPVSSGDQEVSWNGTPAAERASPNFAKFPKGPFGSFYFREL